MDSPERDADRSEALRSLPDYKNELMAMVDKLLSDEWTAPQFEEKIYSYYVDEVPEDAPLSDRDWEFFGIVHEMLDYTAADPSPEGRVYGYMNYEEYKAWVADTRKRYESNEAIVPLGPELTGA